MKLNELERIGQEATQGPWELSYHASSGKPSSIISDLDNPEWIPNGGVGGYAVTVREPSDEQAYIDWHGNGEFICQSRNHWQAFINVAKAVKPFTHGELCELLGSNAQCDDSPVFQRNGAILTIGDFRRARVALKKLEEI